MLENAKSCIVYGHYKKSLLCLKEFKGRIIYLRTSFVNWCYMIHIHTYMVNLTIWNQSHKKNPAKQRKFQEMHFLLNLKRSLNKRIFSNCWIHTFVLQTFCTSCVPRVRVSGCQKHILHEMIVFSCLVWEKLSKPRKGLWLVTQNFSVCNKIYSK